jgi:hypothetical protein
LSGEERKHLVAHSVTAMLVVRSTELYSRAVEIAVLEHHERMDGSGYPRGIRATPFRPWTGAAAGQVVSAFFGNSRTCRASACRSCRADHKSYPADLVHLILPLLYDEIGPGKPLALLQAEFSHSIAALGLRCANGANSGASFPSNGSKCPMHRRRCRGDSLAQLQKAAGRGRLHPSQQLDVLSYFRDDALGMSELALVNREALWQLQAIMNDCLRRWPTLGRAAPRWKSPWPNGARPALS